MKLVKRYFPEGKEDLIKLAEIFQKQEFSVKNGVDISGKVIKVSGSEDEYFVSYELWIKLVNVLKGE